MLRLARCWLLDGDPAALAAPYRQRLLLAPGLHDEVRAVFEEPSLRRGWEEDQGGSEDGVHLSDTRRTARSPRRPGPQFDRGMAKHQVLQSITGPRMAARGAALAVEMLLFPAMDGDGVPGILVYDETTSKFLRAIASILQLAQTTLENMHK